MESKIKQYRSTASQSSTKPWYLRELDTTLSLTGQFRVISSIPNYHRWCWPNINSKSQFKYEQRFSTSCKYYPGSPRNRIVQAWCYRDDPLPIINACIRNILGVECGVPYPIRMIVGAGRSYRRRQPTVFHEKVSTQR